MANPRWWHEEHDAAWARVQPIVQSIAEDEEACRFGAGARQHYGIAYPEWDDRVEAKMREDWERLETGRPWVDVRDAVRRGWDRATN